MSVDTIAKKITVSLKDSIVEWESHKVIDPELMALKVGQVLKNAKVSKLIYGGSYIVEFPESGIALNGFLHKSQIAEYRKQEDDDSDEQQAPEKELTVGQTLETVKVKEINYLDRTPIVSIRPSLLGTDALNYSTIEAGQYFSAMIEKVNLEKKFITLAVNSYVKGNLHIEHMADNNIKQMPPKFLEVGKEIKVRVFNVKASKRFIEFTKKDSLMKGDVPIF
jgi:ribosomal protein S1